MSFPSLDAKADALDARAEDAFLKLCAEAILPADSAAVLDEASG
jgi:hypothetical protein